MGPASDMGSFLGSLWPRGLCILLDISRSYAYPCGQKRGSAGLASPKPQRREGFYYQKKGYKTDQPADVFHFLLKFSLPRTFAHTLLDFSPPSCHCYYPAINSKHFFSISLCPNPFLHCQNMPSSLLNRKGIGTLGLGKLLFS